MDYFNKLQKIGKPKTFEIENGKIIITSSIECESRYHNDFTSCYITGVVHNNTKKYLDIKIKTKVYDYDGVVIFNKSTTVNGIEPGEKRAFKTLIFSVIDIMETLMSISDYELSCEYKFY